MTLEDFAAFALVAHVDDVVHGHGREATSSIALPRATTLSAMSLAEPRVLTEAEARRGLEELADRVAAAQDVLDDARAARDAGIVRLVDVGYRQNVVARWAKVHPKQVFDALKAR